MKLTNTWAAMVVAFFNTDNRKKCVDTSETLENRIKIIINLKICWIEKWHLYFIRDFYYEVLSQLNYMSMYILLSNMFLENKFRVNSGFWKIFNIFESALTYLTTILANLLPTQLIPHRDSPFLSLLLFIIFVYWWPVSTVDQMMSTIMAFAAVTNPQKNAGLILLNWRLG